MRARGTGAPPGAGVAIGGAAEGDDARVDGGQAIVVEAEALHGAGAEVVGDDVGLGHQLEEEFLALGVGNVHAEAALVARAVIDQVAGLVPPLFAGLAVGEGAGLAVLGGGRGFPRG